MKLCTFRSLALALVVALAPAAVWGNSLTISPTSLSVSAPNQTATLTIRSGGRSIAHGQVRVFRATQAGGVEQLTPTQDVVASPAALRLSPNQETTVRFVRRTNSAVQGRECYRVLVDQLPTASADGVAVNFTVRHSIPLCFVAG